MSKDYEPEMKDSVYLIVILVSLLSIFLGIYMGSEHEIGNAIDQGYGEYYLDGANEKKFRYKNNLPKKTDSEDA